jgi:N-acetyl-anhydromuramyl-L-alanine amidase AmpD
VATSPEFPDLPWVPPKSWDKGRPSGGQPTLIVIHTTEGSEGLRSAEDGASYDTRRTDGVSTHFFCDQDTTVQCVKTTDTAHAARATGNGRGVHFELCGRAAQTPAQWDDAASDGTIRQAARIAARVAKKHGIPVRRLTVDQVRAGMKGFCEHKTISDAWGETDHQDPGKNYPWSEFLALVQEELGGTDVSQADVIAALKSDEGKKALASAAWRTDDVLEAPPEHGEGNDYWAALSYLKDIQARARRTELALKTTGDALLAAVQALASRKSVDEVALGNALAAAVLAQLPTDTDDVTVEELTAALRALVTPAA